MIVILKRDIKGSGKAGDIVKVSDGYARNLLIPKGWAVEATDGNVRNLEKVKQKQEEEKAARKASAEELANKLKNIELTIKTKAGEGGRLFGSITSKDIVDALEKQEGIKIDKKKVQIDTPIKSLGKFDVTIKIYTEINGILTVKVAE